MELAKLESHQMDRKMLKKNLDMYRKSPVNDHGAGAEQRPRSSEAEVVGKPKTPTRRWNR